MGEPGPGLTPDNIANQGRDIPQQTPNQVIERVTQIYNEHPRPGSMLEHVAQGFTGLRAENSTPEAWQVRSVLEKSYDTNPQGTGFFLEPNPDFDEAEDLSARQNLTESERAAIEEVFADLQGQGFEVNRSELMVRRSNGILGEGQVAAQIEGFGEVGHERVYIMPTEPHQYATVTVDTRDFGDEYLLYTEVPEKAKHPSEPDDPDSKMHTYIYLPGEHVDKPVSTLRDE